MRTGRVLFSNRTCDRRSWNMARYRYPCVTGYIRS